MNNNKEIIKEIKEYAGSVYDVNGEEYVMIFNQEWDEIIEICRGEHESVKSGRFIKNKDDLRKKMIDYAENGDKSIFANHPTAKRKSRILG